MEFIIVSFATYGIVMALLTTDGPFDIFRKLKNMKYSKVFECFTCASFWASGLISIIPSGNLSTWFLLTVAGAGGAIFIDLFSDR